MTSEARGVPDWTADVAGGEAAMLWLARAGRSPADQNMPWLAL